MSASRVIEGCFRVRIGPSESLIGPSESLIGHYTRELPPRRLHAHLRSVQACKIRPHPGATPPLPLPECTLTHLPTNTPHHPTHPHSYLTPLGLPGITPRIRLGACPADHAPPNQNPVSKLYTRQNILLAVYHQDSCNLTLFRDTHISTDRPTAIKDYGDNILVQISASGARCEIIEATHLKITIDRHDHRDYPSKSKHR
jgi:hypothetical protein